VKARLKKLLGFLWPIEKPPVSSIPPSYVMEDAIRELTEAVPIEHAFCIRESAWRHSNYPLRTLYQVTIFRGETLVTQIEKPSLKHAVECAREEYGLSWT